MTAKLWGSSAGGGQGLARRDFGARSTGATFVLALAVAAQLALIVVGLTGRKRQAPPPPVAMAAIQPLDVGTLINAHLFGNAAAQASGDAANAPPSSMPLVLAGVLATEDPKEGMAIIGESAQAAKVVSVGQQVPGGAQLHSVYNDRAIIERGGVLESVFLPKTTGGAIGMPPPPMAAAPASNEAMVERMRKLVNEDPGLIGQVMRPQPGVRGRQDARLPRLSRQHRQAFARIGLRPGDLVTAINGTPLDDKDRAQKSSTRSAPRPTPVSALPATGVNRSWCSIWPRLRPRPAS